MSRQTARPPWAVRHTLRRPFFLRLPFRRQPPHDRMTPVENDMDKELVAALARAAGLDKALAEFPNDVARAAEQALGNHGAIAFPTDPAAEPWPPMRAGEAL
jgi:hypothetical protein